VTIHPALPSLFRSLRKSSGWSGAEPSSESKGLEWPSNSGSFLARLSSPPQAARSIHLNIPYNPAKVGLELKLNSGNRANGRTRRTPTCHSLPQFKHIGHSDWADLRKSSLARIRLSPDYTVGAHPTSNNLSTLVDPPCSSSHSVSFAAALRLHYSPETAATALSPWLDTVVEYDMRTSIASPNHKSEPVHPSTRAASNIGLF